MKKLSIFAFFLTIGLLFTSCEENENPIFDNVNGQTLAQLSASAGALATPAEGASMTVNVLVTTVSNTDRAISFVTSEDNTATAGQYQLSGLVIPAGEYVGTVTITSVFAGLPDQGSVYLDLNLTGIEGSDAYVENGNIRVEMFKKCDIPAGNYVIDMQDSYGDGWNGASITVTIDGVATDYTVSAAQGSAAQHVINVPSGTDQLDFAFNSGSWDSEITYQITSPNNIVIINDGPNPTIGTVVYNPCNI
ncbi:hypothetical protein [Pseudotenacibaculum haliotis]|uniref:DUF4382 domain-containing protein n=1 Tax=Pseudotenacibaculum haliotis TaxID=1862138 RepID=A0ABW5LQZ9_9FLAO